MVIMVKSKTVTLIQVIMQIRTAVLARRKERGGRERRRREIRTRSQTRKRINFKLTPRLMVRLNFWFSILKREPR
jgi:ribose 1,5-bisphosphokinase PhnN